MYRIPIVGDRELIRGITEGNNQDKQVEKINTHMQSSEIDSREKYSANYRTVVVSAVAGFDAG